MSYSDVSDFSNQLKEISIYDVKEGQSVFYEGNWYKALEDAHVNNGMVGFRAEDEDFQVSVVEVRKNDLGYAPKLYIEP